MVRVYQSVHAMDNIQISEIRESEIGNRISYSRTIVFFGNTKFWGETSEINEILEISVFSDSKEGLSIEYLIKDLVKKQ